jgi:hypothetical protein
MNPSLKRLAHPLLQSAQQEVAKPQQRKAEPAHKRLGPPRYPRAIDCSSALLLWEEAFRAEARADDYACFRRLLKHLGLETFTPKQVLEGTIELVRYCLAYSAGLDGHPFLPFLRLQTYNPSQSRSARYTFAFDIHQRGIGRLLQTRKFRSIDLADLYGQSYDKYKRVGFSDLWILRADYKPLPLSERRHIEQAVLDDLYYDYAENEIEVSFGTDWADRVLVQVQDIYD